MKIFRPCVPRFRRKDPSQDNIAYTDTRILRITFWFTSIIAALLPIISLVVLVSCVRSKAARLGVIAAFNVLIALFLGWFTEASRKDILLVTTV
jgi:uncharacterized membrane protein YqjE